MMEALLQKTMQGDFKSISRCISLVENEVGDYEILLKSLPYNENKPIIGITGPPGAGKSTIVDSLIGSMVNSGKQVAVLCVDPSSPFNMGALLGDRIRMSDWYSHPSVFIRSLASRGSLGGLNHKIIEITDLLRTAPFDFIIVETVGVGQSEVEIAGLADVTVVVLVPESGDEVQAMKAGLMEIADIFVVNKSDRPDADLFVKNLCTMMEPAYGKMHHEIPVLKTIASQKSGIGELFQAILASVEKAHQHHRKLWLLTEKAYQLIQYRKMKSINRESLRNDIEALRKESHFNLYSFVEGFSGGD